MLSRNETHMTTVVREAMTRRLLVRQSSFAKFGSNPILQRYAIMNETHLAAQRAEGKRFPKALKLQVTILEQRAAHLRTTLGGTLRLPGLPVNEDCKARTLYSLSRLGVQMSRYVVMWMLGRYVGKPRACLHCKEPRCATNHFIECCQAQELDAACWARRWTLALPLIQRILERAEGLELADLLLEPPAWYQDELEVHS